LQRLLFVNSVNDRGGDIKHYLQVKRIIERKINKLKEVNINGWYNIIWCLHTKVSLRS